MEFELLRSFVAVAESGVNRAAERLNLTQSTVSRQVKRLELAIFERKRPDAAAAVLTAVLVSCRAIKSPRNDVRGRKPSRSSLARS
jgi:DNA-binding transcriptional LysR family regulator